jgi:tRNA(Ile)-lysidine synthetase-like protein
MDPAILFSAIDAAFQGLSPGAGIVVAVSGGLDSMVLLHLLAARAHHFHVKLHVGHIDHNLRPGSAADAAFVKQQAAALGLPCTVTTVPRDEIRRRKGGLEAAAREVRYHALCSLACAVALPRQRPAVALAHHANDQAETLLMRLLSGSGLKGMSAMQPRATRSEPDLLPVTLLRPLLGWERATLVDFATREGIAWREDPTNADTRFLRNRIRHELMPVLEAIQPDAVEALGRTAVLLAAELKQQESDLEESLRTLAVERTPDRIVLDLTGWRKRPVAERRTLLKAIWSELADDPREISLVRVEDLRKGAEALDARYLHGPYPLAGNLAWTLVGSLFAGRSLLVLHQSGVPPIVPDEYPAMAYSGQRITLAADETVTVGKWRLKVELLPIKAAPRNWDALSPWACWMDADRVDELQLATVSPGDRIAPLGMKGQSRSVGDVMTDRRVPSFWRPAWPLVTGELAESREASDGGRRPNGTVVWLCGIMLSHEVRLRPSTKRCWHLRWERVPLAAGKGRG